MCRFLLAMLICAPAYAQITWTKRWIGAQSIPTGLTSGYSEPRYNGYLQDRFDPVSGRVIHYGIRAFSGNVSVTSGSPNVTWVSGDKFSTNWTTTECSGGACELWLGSATACGGNRCYVNHSTSDTALVLTANYTGGTNANLGYSAAASGIYSTDVFLYNSVNYTWTRTAKGTGDLRNFCSLDASDTPGARHPDGQMAVDTTRNKLWLLGGVNGGCTGPAPDVTPRQDMYYMTLNSNPANNAWTRVTPTTLPEPLYTATMIYSTDDDVLFLYGQGSVRNWVYCVGTPNATQIAAGCTTGDTWNPVTVVGGVQPPAFSWPGMVYDSINKKVILFGGFGGGVAYNQTWAYHIPTKTWVNKNPSNPPPTVAEIFNYQPPIAFNSNDGQIYLHVAASPASDYRYNYTTNTWTNLGNLGGPTYTHTMTFDPAGNRLLAWAQCQSGGCSGSAEMWEGQLSGPVITTNISLTVQETLYAGASGVARVDEPFCMGVPIADGEGITDTSKLGLSGARAGQFRILGTWPSGNAKWIKVCGILPTLPAGGTTIVALQNGGSGAGSFGGPNMATDNGSTITVATGAATFTIKKANFNGFDVVDAGTTRVVTTSNSATRGLVLTGPDPNASYPGNVTCSPQSGGSTCATLYSSANDSSSTCSIEENGPVMTALKCTGTHKDNSGHPYMQYTARMYFYKDKTSVKFSSVLRNANYDTATDTGGGTFNTAYKGIKAYELRLGANISGALNYTIANHTGTPTTGAMNGADHVYIYQGQSQFMVSGESSCLYQSNCANKFTTDTGYRINKNGSDLITGSSTQIPQGWADISNSSGVGIQIGIYQMAAYFPKSLEFASGGMETRIGILPFHNTKIFYQPWPQWTINDLLLNFHASTPPSPASDFLKFQHYLAARPSLDYVNTTAVFPYSMPTKAQENDYYTGLSTTASPSIGLASFCHGGTTPCFPDSSPSLPQQALNLGVYRSYIWSSGGPLNQAEFRWSDLQKFYQHGYMGRFLNSSHFYRWFAERAQPHADGTTSADSTINGFTWRARPHAGAVGAELNGLGYPNATRGNAALGDTCGGDACWMDILHPHWHGLLDYYFMTGDETIKEAIVPMKNWFLNTDTYQMGAAGGPSYTRSIGIILMNGSRFSSYLAATGEGANSSSLLSNLTTLFENTVKPDLCVTDGTNVYPTGCTMPPLHNPSPDDPYGVSRVRGVPGASQMRASDWCNQGRPPFRIQSYFQPAILVEGLHFLRAAKGPGWSDYKLALDLAFGISQWALSEMYGDDGSSTWCPSCSALATPRLFNGFKYGEVLDQANVCPSGATGLDIYTIGGRKWHDVYGALDFATVGQNTMPYFWTIYQVTGSTSWSRQLAIQNQIVGLAASGGWPADFGQYQMSYIISILSNPTNKRLQNIPFSISNMGSGNYRLTFNPSAGTDHLRIKWSPKTITDISLSNPKSGLLQFDSLLTNTFGINPAANMTWFGANNTIEPAPTPGASQSFDISTGVAGLTGANFSVKGFSPAVCVIDQTFLPSGVVGVPYSQQLTASNCGSGTWTITNGSMCSGLLLSSSGLISGTPTTQEICNFSGAYSTGSGSFSITIQALAKRAATAGRASARGRVSIR